jgi:prolyl-tRNA synthetase
MAEKITPRSVDYSRWYTDLIQEAQLADYSPVRGCMVIRPNGYAIWEKIQAELDKRFKETGHQNLYFPLFIPESFLKREAEHVEGFAPECAVVTHGGGKELEEPLVVRPTSETIIWHMYQKWISSYRDLPLLYNQWANVVRWEMRTRLFLRTTEFLWQEGHTAHACEEEARQEALRMLEVYRTFVQDKLAIPVLSGRKTQREKFAGAVDTYCIEGMMQDGKALQMGTSHYLGQNFAKAFDVRFQDKDGGSTYVFATSWGVSTRLIGGLIMAHSDDHGLILPPAIASTQIVIVPIWRSEEDKRAIRDLVTTQLLPSLKEQWQVHFDDREEVHPGFKYHEWEVRGIPIRLEIGPRDLKNGQVVLVRRDTAEKQTIALTGLVLAIKELLEAMQHNLFSRALATREARTFHLHHYEEFKKQAEEGGFIYAPWCGQTACEASIAEETKASIRIAPQEEGSQKSSKVGPCIRCQQPAIGVALFARSY